MPVTPRTSNLLSIAKIQKDSLLKNINNPRIIFVGGSNLSFGLNSQLIKDSLLLNPINTTLNAGIGLQYMLNNTLPYIQESDIIVIAPEYGHFYGNSAYGNEILLKIVADTDISRLRNFKKKQIKNIFRYIPKYGLSKFDPTEYFWIRENTIYGANSFNKYGDTFKHWELEQQIFSAYEATSQPYNYEIINLLKNFEKEVDKKKAILFITYPGLQASSFNNKISQIKKVEKELKKANFKLLGTPLRYKIPDTMMFNSPYHLLKKGVDYRTQLLIEDIKKALMHNDI